MNNVAATACAHLQEVGFQATAMAYTFVHVYAPAGSNTRTTMSETLIALFPQDANVSVSEARGTLWQPSSPQYGVLESLRGVTMEFHQTPARAADSTPIGNGSAYSQASVILLERVPQGATVHDVVRALGFTLPLSDVGGIFSSHTAGRWWIVRATSPKREADLVVTGIVILGIRVTISVHPSLPEMRSPATQLWLHPPPGQRPRGQWRSTDMLDRTGATIKTGQGWSQQVRDQIASRAAASARARGTTRPVRGSRPGRDISPPSEVPVASRPSPVAPEGSPHPPLAEWQGLGSVLDEIRHQCASINTRMDGLQSALRENEAVLYERGPDGSRVSQITTVRQLVDTLAPAVQVLRAGYSQQHDDIREVGQSVVRVGDSVTALTSQVSQQREDQRLMATLIRQSMALLARFGGLDPDLGNHPPSP